MAMADNIAHDLRQFRARLRLTQEELASKIGASRSQYANWENPDHPHSIPFEYRVKLANLGLDSLAVGVVAESLETYRVRATPGQLSLMIEVLFDCSASPDIRENARAELRAALNLQ